MFRRIALAVGSASEESLQAASTQLCALGTGSTITRFHVDTKRPGETLDALLNHAASEQVDLLVLGARSHVTARRVAMLAPCSVLMVPDQTALRLTRLLVPVDFSSTAAEAVREGARIAAASGGHCKVVAVECDDDPWLDWHDSPHHLDNRLEEFLMEAVGKNHNLTTLVQPIERTALRRDHGPHELPRGVEGSDIAETILGVAEQWGTTMIVMGTRGRTSAASILIGSVTEKVVQMSPIPVLAVKQHGERLGLLEGLMERLRGRQPLVVS